MDLLEAKGKHKVEDLSKVRIKPFNLKKRNYPFIGRKKIIHNILNILNSENKIINICGEKGIGKTEIIKELAYNAYRLNYYSFIYYFCLNKNLTSIEDLKKKFREIDNLKVPTTNQPNDTSILIILDHCDLLIKNNYNQFNLLINSFISNQNFFIFTTLKEISEKTLNCYSIRIPVLDYEEENENIYMFLNICKRKIEMAEIDVDENIKNSNTPGKSLIDLLKMSTRIRKCRGLPNYIKQLAKRCSTQSLMYIKMSFPNENIEIIPFINQSIAKDLNKTYCSPYKFPLLMKSSGIEINPNSDSKNNSFNSLYHNQNSNISGQSLTQSVFLHGTNKFSNSIFEKDEGNYSKKESANIDNHLSDDGKNSLRTKNSGIRKNSITLEEILEENDHGKDSKYISKMSIFLFLSKGSKDSKSSCKLSINCPFSKSSDELFPVEKSVPTTNRNSINNFEDNLELDSLVSCRKAVLYEKRKMNENNIFKLANEIKEEDKNPHFSWINKIEVPKTFKIFNTIASKFKYNLQKNKN